MISREDYYKIHLRNLTPLKIKIDKELFLKEITEYDSFFRVWGDKFKEFPRYAIPLVNLNGKLDNVDEPSCWPLDRWYFINHYEDTPENFTNFYNNLSFSNIPEDALIETSFRIPTDLMKFKSLEPLRVLKKHMTRSCILKWHSMGHLKPHYDTDHPTKWLRLWGTVNSEKMKIRYLNDNEKGNQWNDIKKRYENYVEERNIEDGRIYLHDSIKWHDAFAYGDDVYQFFISLDVSSYDTLKELIL